MKKISNNPSGRPRSEQLTKRIHAAFFSLLEPGSYHSLTLEAIAREAGVSRPALYRRYGSVGRVALAALESAGGEALPMVQTADLGQDLRRYFIALTAAVESSTVLGRALRAVLSESLSDAAFAPAFRAFLERRREPVRLRLRAQDPVAPPERIEAVMDALFGPVLYLQLIRQVEVGQQQIAWAVDGALFLLTAAQAEMP